MEQLKLWDQKIERVYTTREGENSTILYFFKR